jgi:hypothetical protein
VTLEAGGAGVCLVQLRDILFIFNLYEKIQNKKFGRGVCFHGEIELFTYEGHLIFENDIVEWIFLKDKDGIYQFYEFGNIFLPVLDGQKAPEIYNPN